MLTNAFNSMFKSVSHKLKQLQSSYLVHICIYMTAVAALNNFVNLTYRSRLTDFGVCYSFKVIIPF